jgi:hypothetical protein
MLRLSANSDVDSTKKFSLPHWSGNFSERKQTMNEKAKYSKPEVVTLGTTGEFILGDKVGLSESGFDALEIMAAD